MSKNDSKAMAWLGLIRKKDPVMDSPEKADPDEVIAEIKVLWESWFNSLLPGLFESQAFKNAIAAMPKEPPAWDRGTANQEAHCLADVLLKIKGRQELHRMLGVRHGEYDVDMAKQQAYWKERRNELHTHLVKALEIFESGQLSDAESDGDPTKEHRPKHHLDVDALREWVKSTRIIHPMALFSRCPNPRQDFFHAPFEIKSAKGGHSLDSRVIQGFIRSVLYRVPEDTHNRFATVRDLLALADTEVRREQVKDAANARGA